MFTSFLNCSIMKLIICGYLIVALLNSSLVCTDSESMFRSEHKSRYSSFSLFSSSSQTNRSIRFWSELSKVLNSFIRDFASSGVISVFPSGIFQLQLSILSRSSFTPGTESAGVL